MQLTILTGLQLQNRPELKVAIHGLRHKVFVETLGWEVLRRVDGQEIDAFDTAEAVHFIVLSKKGKIAAYSRMIPTTQPHLLSHVYPHLLQGAALPAGSHIWEWTRGINVPMPTTSANAHHQVDSLGISISPAGRLLVVGIVEWSMRNDVEMLSIQCESGYEMVMQRLGVEARVLAGKSVTSEGADIAPVMIQLEKDTAKKLRRAFGMAYMEIDRARL